MKIARFIVTFNCNRHCDNCCNTHESVMSKAVHVQSIWELAEFDRILITGGEPMLYPNQTANMAMILKGLGKEVFMYTAMYRPEMIKLMPVLDGIHFTLHHPIQFEDLTGFYNFQHLILDWAGSYRLYIDNRIDLPVEIAPNRWKRVEVKPWLSESECPLPPDETLVILDGGIQNVDSYR